MSRTETTPPPTGGAALSSRPGSSVPEQPWTAPSSYVAPDSYVQPSPYVGPGPSQPSPSQPSAYVQPSPSQPARLTGTAQRNRHTGWIVALTVTASVLGMIAVLILPGLPGAPSMGAQRLTDPAGRVTVTVPWSWTELTAQDAGQTVEYGDEDRHIPDIEAEAFLASTYLSVDIYRDSLTEGAREHLDYADGMCEELGCTDRSQVETVQVDGHQAYQQVLTHPSDPGFPPLVSLVTTVRTPNQVTMLVVEQDVDDPAGLDGARAIVAGAEIAD